MAFVGLDFYGTHFYRSPTSPVTNIYYGEIKKAIYDELNIRERTDTSMDNVKDPWQIDHRAIFQFFNNLEGGNIENSGLKIVKFAIKRRKINELNPITLAYMDFVNDSELVYYDYTQANAEYIYSVVPIAENGLEGNPSDTTCESDFTGWWVVNKYTNDVLGFDKYIGDSQSTVETPLNQGRAVLETLSEYPRIYYFKKRYHTFTLSTVIIPSEFERSGVKYEEIISKFIDNHVPLIVKSSDGRIFVADASTPKLSSPLNTWKQNDYGILTMDFVEIQGYNEFMRESI